MTNLLNIQEEVNKVLYGDSYSEDAEAKFNYAIVKAVKNQKNFGF